RGRNGQEDLFAALTAQQLANVLRRQCRDTVDGRDHVPCLHVELRIGQWRPLGRVVRVTSIDVVDAVAAPALVAEEPRSQRGHLDLVFAGAQVTAADGGVQRGELAYRPPDQVVELRARRDARQERGVLVERRPVV